LNEAEVTIAAEISNYVLKSDLRFISVDNKLLRSTMVTSTNSSSFCTKIFMVDLTNLRSSYVSRRILTAIFLLVQKHTVLRASNFAHFPLKCDVSLSSLTLPKSEPGDFVELLLL